MKAKRRIAVLFITAMIMMTMMQTSALAAVKLNKKSVTIQAGNSVTLKVNTKKAVSWKSGNKNIVAVSKKGKVTGLSAGKTIVKAKVKGSKKTLTCKVTVTAKPASTASSEATTGTTSGNASSNTTTTSASTGSSSGSKMTEEETRVYNILVGMRDKFPEGMKYTNEDFYLWNGGIYLGGYGCAGFAMRLSDEAFGNAPAKKHTNFDNIKVGDIVRMDNNTHSVIVLKNNGTSIVVAEGNYNGKVHWGRTISLKEVKSTGTNVLTRY